MRLSSELAARVVAVAALAFAAWVIISGAAPQHPAKPAHVTTAATVQPIKAQ